MPTQMECFLWWSPSPLPSRSSGLNRRPNGLRSCAPATVANLLSPAQSQFLLCVNVLMSQLPVSWDEKRVNELVFIKDFELSL